jgi:hypothetical protein
MFGRPPSNFGPPGPSNGLGPYSPFPVQPSQQGGFLSKLFGGASGPGFGGVGGGPGSGILGFLNPAKGGGTGILGTIQNVEKVIKMAQTVKPMIDQYGPMIKNLPSMLDLIKEYQRYSTNQDQASAETNTDSDEDSFGLELEEEKTSHTKTKTPIQEKKIKKQTLDTKPKKEIEYKKSIPRLYV